MRQEQKKYTEIRISEKSEVINVSADALWKIVREFQDVSNWFSSIDHVTASGESKFEGAPYSERTCYVNLKDTAKYTKNSPSLMIIKENSLMS